MTKKPKQSATSATNNKICASVANPKRSAKPQKQFEHSWKKTQAKRPSPIPIINYPTTPPSQHTRQKTTKELVAATHINEEARRATRPEAQPNGAKLIAE